ncbi:MAG: shikimate kinase [FCB group bacterium]|nr:shikimate kinase [FCB group bacterium]
MNIKKDIFLIGFSGSGKSTIGPKLAAKLKVKFYDTDSIIEKKLKMKTDNIFSEYGEKHFRRLEERTISDIINFKKHQKVVSLGGGAFQSRKVRNLVKKSGVVIYLSCSQKVLYQRMKNKTDRPLLRLTHKSGKTALQKLKDRINQLMQKRIKNYRQANIIFSTSDKSINESVSQLNKKIIKYYAEN